MTTLFNPAGIGRSLAITIVALTLSATCLLAAAGPAEARTATLQTAVQTAAASVIIGGE